jgi:Domain of unknown function (DUF4388)
MQNNRFVVLTGHLNDYPLSDLVGILRHQQKTGRLLIEYPQNPATFYFQEGELVDVQLGSLTGLQAICVAMAQPASTFNFNPLIRPSRRSIDNSLQRVVSELFGCWDDSPEQIEVTTEKALPTGDNNVPFAPALPAPTSPPEREILEPPRLLTAAPASNQNRTVLVLTAAGIMMLGLSSIIAVTSRSRGQVESSTVVNQPLASKPTTAEPVSDLTATAQPEPRKPAVENPISRSRESKVNEQERHSLMSQDARNETPRNVAATPDLSAATSSTKPTPALKQDNEKSNEGATKYQLIDVVMQIENGRVLQAAISNHRSGMGGYEAMALRIARQRRYPAKTTGQETVRIRVDQPD